MSALSPYAYAFYSFSPVSQASQIRGQNWGETAVGLMLLRKKKEKNTALTTHAHSLGKNTMK
jgi:hypothetical protein